MEVEELRQENRRELLLKEEQGCPRRLVLLCLLAELAPQIKYRPTIRCDGACSADQSPRGHTPCAFFPRSCDFFSFSIVIV